MLAKVTSAAMLGALASRLDLQEVFGRTLQQTMTGIGRLVDADMDEVSTRLKALQTQKPIALQALQLANADAQATVQLFQ
ncbi:hypothetical protein CN933_15155 [Sinorhizobium sp. M4_45]|nr:hypothetical protein CN933_15155 [Sinorhizobium sp. M4_45]